MLRRLGCLAVVAALVGVAAQPSGSDAPALETSPVALPAVTAPVSDAASCAIACQSRHDTCRVSTKGGPNCDSDRQRCLQACIARKSR